jgi:hypothetical protein
MRHSFTTAGARQGLSVTALLELEAAMHLRTTRFLNTA